MNIRSSHPEEAALDAALGAAPAPAAGEALKRRLLEDYDAVQRRRRGAGWPEIFAPLLAFGRFAPVGAAAGLVILGGVLGSMTASMSGASAEASDAAAYVEEAFVVAFAEDEEALLWAED